MELNDRTWGVFDTAAFRAGTVNDDTFHEHARATLEGIRKVLLDGGWKASGVETHGHDGVVMTVDVSGCRTRLLLQAVGPWLLTLTRRRTLFERLRGAPGDGVPVELVHAVRASLYLSGAALASRWFTRAEYEEAARVEGGIDLTLPSVGDWTHSVVLRLDPSKIEDADLEVRWTIESALQKTLGADAFIEDGYGFARHSDAMFLAYATRDGDQLVRALVDIVERDPGLVPGATIATAPRTDAPPMAGHELDDHVIVYPAQARGGRLPD